jgi:outer membrane protein insertion porin family
VVRVEVRSESSIDRAQVEPLLAVRPGLPLDDDDVHQTLRSLRLSGIAAEVELWQRPVAGGVEAIFVLRPDVRVTAVSVEGDTGLDAKRLAAEVEQRPGEPLREDRVVRGVYAIEDALAAQGWLDARARLSVATDPASKQARVTYVVEAGERTHVGAVRFEGLGGAVPEADALGALRARSGSPLVRAVVRNDADRLQRFLVRDGYRLATVEPAAQEPHPETRTVDLVWHATPGPKVDFVLEGADRRTLEKHDLLPFLGDGGFDEALLVQSVDLIKTYYQEHGYYDVSVTPSEERSPDHLELRIRVVPGARSTLEEIRFEGNQAFSSERLARLMKTAPRRLLTPGSGRLVDSDLIDDLANLRSFYALAGYDRARIGPTRVERKGSRLTLVVPVAEGLKRSVAGVSIEGLVALDAAKIVSGLPLRAGGPFHRLLLDSSAESIRSQLEALGYRAAIVSPEVEWNPEGTVAQVTFHVLEGSVSTADAILLRGNARTRTEVLRRFVGIHEGDPISTTALLDVQRRLYRLGVFSRVSVRVPPTTAAAADHEVLIEVEEGRTLSASYGAGYDSESGARGLLRLTESNLFGRLVTVQGDALVSQKDQAYRLLARQPYFGPWPVESSVLAYRELENRPSFDVRRRGLKLGLDRTYARDRGLWRVGLYYDYRIVALETSEPVDVIPRESRDARVASLTPSVGWDSRDDPLDPTRGWSGLLQVERAYPVLAADSDFAKLFGQWTGYLPLRRAGVLAASLRGGAIEPYGRPTDPSLAPIDAVPAAELFYAGGRTSHRAFARDELGIPGQTLFVEPGKDPVPLGGGVLALLNVDWRFPILGDFGGSVFVDGGNVWRTVRDFDPGQSRWGVGLGLRYRSPIGPLRVEIGWKLDRKSYESPYVVSFSLGNPF